MTNQTYYPGIENTSLLSRLSPIETAQLMFEFTSYMARFFPNRHAQTEAEPNPRETLSGQISSLLTRIGVPAHVCGFRYLAEAVRLCMDDPTMVNRITLRLYPAVAERLNVSVSSVERCIRHSIDLAWERQRPGAADDLLGRNVISSFEKPTNSELIAILVEYLTRHRESAQNTP